MEASTLPDLVTADKPTTTKASGKGKFDIDRTTPSHAHREDLFFSPNEYCNTPSYISHATF
jgi:hypothetical protein